MQKCSKCHQTTPCGCNDTPLTTYAPSSACPDPQQCTEFTYTGCLVYNGPALTDLCITPGMSFNDVIQALVLLSTNTACVTADCPIHAPYVSVGTITGTTINAKWGAVDDILSYTVSYGEEDASPFVWTDVSVSPTATNYTITGLVCATTYLIKVAVVYGSGPTTCESVTFRVTTSDC